MADLPTSTNQPGQGKKELSMELRLLLAFLLMGLVLFVTPYIYKPAPAPKRIVPPTTPAEATQVTQKPAETPAVTKPEAAAAAPGRIAAAQEQNFVVDTALYRVTFSNRGAVVKSWILKKFTTQATGQSPAQPLELVNQAALSKVPAPFSLWMKDDKTASQLNYAYFVEKPSEDHLGVDFDFSDGKTACKKSFRFGKDSYLSEVTTEVTQDGVAVPHLIAWRGGFGDLTVLNRLQAS